MGIFKKLFGIGASNPTEKFPKRLVPPQLIWDTGEKALCGISLGAPFESLAVLGPSDSHRKVSEHAMSLVYADQGLEIDLVRGQVDLFKLFIAPDPEMPRQDLTFGRLTCMPSGKVLGPDSTPAEFSAILGEGKVLYQDEEEIAYTHSNGPIMIEPAFTPSGQLLRIEIYDDRT